MLLSPDSYDNFVSILKSMTPLVTDLQISNGKICQRNSDGNWLISGDLTSIFNNIDDENLKTISLFSIDSKSPMLKMFTDSDNDIEFTYLEAKRSYRLNDGTTSYELNAPDPTIYKKYNTEDLNSFGYNPNKLIAEFDFDKKLLKRATSAITAYGTDIANVMYDSNTSTIKLNFGGKTNASHGALDLFTNVPCTYPCGKTTLKLNVLKTSVGTSAKMRLYMASDEVESKVTYHMVIMTLETELGGCPFEYRQRRRVDAL